MNGHDDYRELLALGLYGELEPHERARLDQHVAHCADCAAFARQLEQGLGRVAPARGAGDLPPGWAERVAAAAQAQVPPVSAARRLAPWLAAAAGFALGIATMGVLAGQRSGDAGARDAGTVDAGTGEAGTGDARTETDLRLAESTRVAPESGEVPRSTAGPGPLTRLAAIRR